MFYTQVVNLITKKVTPMNSVKFFYFCFWYDKIKHKIWTNLKEKPLQIHFLVNRISLLNLKSDKYNNVKEFELEWKKNIETNCQ